MAWPKYDAERESRVAEEIPCFARVFAPESTTVYKRLDTPITPYENMKLIFEGKTPCWLPGDAEMSRFSPRMMIENEVRAFVMDVDPKSTLKFGGKDMFGIEWRYEPTVKGSMVVPGNPVLDDANRWEEVIKFPDISKWDWEGCAKKNAPYISNHSRMTTITIYTGFYERLISFMDFDNAAIAMIDDEQQEAVQALFTKLADLYIDMIDHIVKYFNTDVICLHDDLGSQRAPFFSLSTVREMIVPHIKRVADAVHRHGKYFNLHSCGKSDINAEAFNEMDIDMWYPQPMNDIDMIFDKCYGKFVIGVPAPAIPKDADDDYIRNALRERMEHFKDTPSYATSAGVIFVNEPGITRYQQLMYEESRKFYAEL